VPTYSSASVSSDFDIEWGTVGPYTAAVLVVPYGEVEEEEPAPETFATAPYEPWRFEGTNLALGLDVRVFPMLDASLTPSSDWRTFADSLVRLILTPPGLLAFHPDRGFDVRDFLNDEVTQETLFLLQSGCKTELERDERVDEASVSASYDSSAQKITLSISIQSASGPFNLVVAVDSLTATLLKVES
jgi:hypothetical protein